MPFDLDPAGADFIADPYPSFAQARAAMPIFRSSALGGWVVTRYADCRALLKDPRLSADRMGPFFEHMPADRRRQVERLEATVTRWAVFLDPPDHTRLRTLMNKAFNPRAIEGLAPLVRKRVDALIDAFPAEGRIDFIREFAYPLPATVIADLLGVPLADVDLLKRWSDDLGAFVLTARATPDKYARAETAAREMEQYFGDLVAARRRNPGEDAASWMIGAADRDARMSSEELVATCVLLLFAGHETTTHLLGNGLWALLTHPQQMSLLRERSGDSAFVEGAVEEMLRWDGPSLAQVRVARERVVWHDSIFEPGERVFLMLASANRDGEVFGDPDRFDLTRKPAQNLAFGYGIHFCVGAPLARLEGRVAFPRLVDRLARIELAPQRLRWSDNLVVRGVHALEIDMARDAG